MYFIDSHCHLSKEYIENDLLLAKKNNISKIINISVDKKSIFETLEFVNKHENLYGAVGIHPLYLENLNSEELCKYVNKKIVAFGETGLDLYKSNDLCDQIKSLEIHIEAAMKKNLPLIYHVRNADKEIFPFIHKKLRGVLHSFTSSKELARHALNNGFYISFSGIITFKNAESVREIVKYVPIESILIETDSPFLSPEPHRGKRNHSSNIIYTAKQIAKIKNMELSQVAKYTYSNTMKLFNKINHDSGI